MGFEEPVAGQGADLTSLKSNQKAPFEESVTSASTGSPWQPMELLKGEKKKDELMGGEEFVRYAVKGTEPSVQSGDQKVEFGAPKRFGSSSMARTVIEEPVDGMLQITPLKSKGEVATKKEFAEPYARIGSTSGGEHVFLTKKVVSDPVPFEKNVAAEPVFVGKKELTQSLSVDQRIASENSVVEKKFDQGSSSANFVSKSDGPHFQLGQKLNAETGISAERVAAPIEKLGLQSGGTYGSGGANAEVLSKMGSSGLPLHQVQQGHQIQTPIETGELKKSVGAVNQQFFSDQSFEPVRAKVASDAFDASTTRLNRSVEANIGGTIAAPKPEQGVTSFLHVPQPPTAKFEQALAGKESPTTNLVTQQEQTFTRRQELTSATTGNGTSNFSPVTRGGDQSAALKQSQKFTQGAETGLQVGLPRPEPSRPELSRPELSRPELSRPGLSRPEIPRPEISRPEISRPEFAQLNKRLVAETTPLAELPAKFTKTTAQIAQVEKFAADTQLRAQADRIASGAQLKAQENQPAISLKPNEGRLEVTNRAQEGQFATQSKTQDVQPGLKLKGEITTSSVRQPDQIAPFKNGQQSQILENGLQPKVGSSKSPQVSELETSLQPRVSPLTGKTPQELIAALKPQGKGDISRSFETLMSGAVKSTADRYVGGEFLLASLIIAAGAARRMPDRTVEAQNLGHGTSDSTQTKRGEKQTTFAQDEVGAKPTRTASTAINFNNGKQTLNSGADTQVSTQIVANMAGQRAEIPAPIVPQVKGQPTPDLIVRGERCIPGADIAIAAMLMLGGASRRRPDERVSENPNDLTERNERPLRLDRRLGEIVAQAKSFVNIKEGSEEKLQSSEQDRQSGSSSNSSKTLYRPIWIIAPGETLVSIAEEQFGDGALAWLIADLNSGKFSDSIVEGKRVIEIQSRQKIELPVASDIEEFRHNRKCHEEAENIITIVVASQLDTELREATLKQFLGTVQSNMAIPAMAALPQLDLVQQPRPARLPSFGMGAPGFASIAAAVSLPLIVPQLDMLQKTADTNVHVQEIRTETAKPEETT